MARLIAFKPKGVNETRTHIAALLILDGGYRISELLELPCEGCDFDNLIVKVRGKGNKHRLVPLSIEMRKILYRYSVNHSGSGRLLFGTRKNILVTVRNFERDLKRGWEETRNYGGEVQPSHPPPLCNIPDYASSAHGE